MPTFKELTDYLLEVGAGEVTHTEKGYLSHAISVYNDLRKWGWNEELARTGIFHSIYGTELFQRFTLPLERRAEVRGLIGERAEWLCWLNCAKSTSMPVLRHCYRVLATLRRKCRIFNETQGAQHHGTSRHLHWRYCPQCA